MYLYEQSIIPAESQIAAAVKAEGGVKPTRHSCGADWRRAETDPACGCVRDRMPSIRRRSALSDSAERVERCNGKISSGEMETQDPVEHVVARYAGEG
jgi:hypothetical protein